MSWNEKNILNEPAGELRGGGDIVHSRNVEPKVESLRVL
jgi:hypothetical protein